MYKVLFGTAGLRFPLIRLGLRPMLCVLSVLAMLDFVVCPAFAGAIVAPADDTGIWARVNPYLATAAVTIVGAAITWASTQIARLTGIKMRSELESQVRQTALTGVYKAIHELELRFDERWTPAQRQQVVTKAVAWVMERMPGPLARLGIAGPVVQAIAIKMLGSVLAGNPIIDIGDVGGAAVESPAMARVTGSSAR